LGAFSTNIATTGLNTTTTSIPLAGTYLVTGKLSVPTLVGGAGASSVVTTVTQNSSTMYTGLAGAEGFAVTLNCAAGDTVAVTYASSAAPDEQPNAIKTVISIG
jgi:hypothetical protein